MGKTSYVYTDSDTEDTSVTSLEESVKKKKFSILKYTNNTGKKKKCQVHSKSEPDESNGRSRSKPKYKLAGILKHPDKDESSDEDDDMDSLPSAKPYIQSRCLVGRVPRPAGAKPGRGGGVAIIVKKNASSIPTPQISTSSQKKAKFSKRLLKKRSY